MKKPLNKLILVCAAVTVCAVALAESQSPQVEACVTEEPILRIDPEMPNPRARYRVQGEVDIEFLIRIDGSVDQVKVISVVTQPESKGWAEALSKSTSEAIANWRYASRAKPCKMTQTVQYRFK